jgi:hypothetical protein
VRFKLEGWKLIKTLAAAGVPRDRIDLFIDDSLDVKAGKTQRAFAQDHAGLPSEGFGPLRVDEIEELCRVHRGAWSGQGLMSDVQRLFRRMDPAQRKRLAFIFLDRGARPSGARAGGFVPPGNSTADLTPPLIKALMQWAVTSFEESLFLFASCASEGICNAAMDQLEAQLRAPTGHRLVALTSSSFSDATWSARIIKTALGAAAVGGMFFRSLDHVWLHTTFAGAFSALPAELMGVGNQGLSPCVRGFPRGAEDMVMFRSYFPSVPPEIGAKVQPWRPGGFSDDFRAALVIGEALDFTAAIPVQLEPGESVITIAGRAVLVRALTETELSSVMDDASDDSKGAVDQLSLVWKVCEGLPERFELIPETDAVAIALGEWLEEEFGPARHSGVSGAPHAGRVIGGLLAQGLPRADVLEEAKSRFRSAATALSPPTFEGAEPAGD